MRTLKRAGIEKGTSYSFQPDRNLIKRKEAELSSLLQEIYSQEREIYLTVNTMSWAVTQAMENVQSEPGGTVMSPANVPKAASLLQKYTVRLNHFQSECLAASGDLKMLIHDLAE